MAVVGHAVGLAHRFETVERLAHRRVTDGVHMDLESQGVEPREVISDNIVLVKEFAATVLLVFVRLEQRTRAEFDNAVQVDLDGVHVDVGSPPCFAASHELEDLVAEYARVPADRRHRRDGTQVEVAVVGDSQKLLDMLRPDARAR